MLFAKLLLVVDQMKKDLKMDGWIHMPRTSDKYRLYKMLRFEYKARGYNEFGIITSFDLTKESTIFSIQCYEKAWIIYNLLGIKKNAKAMTNSVGTAKAIMAGDDIDEAIVENMGFSFKRHLESSGSIEHTMQFGFCSGTVLLMVHHGIEAEQQLAIMLAAQSRRVHGPEHDCTLWADKLLEKCYA